MDYILAIFLVVLILGVLPTLFYLFWGWVFTRFERTRDLGVRFLAMSLVAPRMTASCCHRHCESTPCKNWTCENYSHSNIVDK